MGRRIARSDLRPWIAKNKWAWTPIGLVILIMAPFVWAAVLLWEERDDLIETMADYFKLMTHNIKEEEDTNE